MAKTQKKTKEPAKTMKGVVISIIVSLVISLASTIIETYGYKIASYFNFMIVLPYLMMIACVVGLVLIKSKKNLTDYKKAKWLNLLQVGTFLVFVLTAIADAVRSDYYIFNVAKIGEDVAAMDSVFTPLAMLPLVYGLISQIVVSNKLKYIGAEVRAEKKAKKQELKEKQRAINKALAEKKAEEKRILAEQKAEEKRKLDEQRAEEKRIKEEQLAKEKQELQAKLQAEQKEALTKTENEENKKQVTEKPVKAKAIEVNNAEISAKVKEDKPFGFRDISRFQWITVCVTFVLMIVLCAFGKVIARSNNTGALIGALFIPAVSISFMFFGIYLIRHFKKWWKMFGVGSILFGIFSYAIMLSFQSQMPNLGEFTYNLVMQFVPVREGAFCALELQQFVVNGFAMENAMEFYIWSSMSTTLYVGTLLYLFFPAKKIFKSKYEMVNKDSPLRYYICMFSSITVIIVVTILLIWFAFIVIKFFLGLFGVNIGGGSVAKSSGSGTVCFVDDYGTVILETWEFNKLKDVTNGSGNATVMKFDGHRFYPYGKNEHIVIGILEETAEKPYINIYSDYSSEFGKYHHLYLSKK